MASWVKGQSGNPNGQPKKPEIEMFRNAIAQVEKENKLGLLVHAVRRAYIEDAVLVALLKKILPDKFEDENARKIIEVIRNLTDEQLKS